MRATIALIVSMISIIVTIAIAVIGFLILEVVRSSRHLQPHRAHLPAAAVQLQFIAETVAFA
jgi:zinc transporter ZupT